MKFIYGKNDFCDFQSGNKHCYLLTNGLGGYSSTTLINSLSRADHSFFTAAIVAPNLRKNIVNKVIESLIIDDREINLSSQEFVSYTKNIEGFVHLESFKQEYLPQWTYFFDGITIKKTVVFQHEKNTIGTRYTVENNSSKSVKLKLTPVFQFTDKSKTNLAPIELSEENDLIIRDDLNLFIKSNYDEKSKFSNEFENDYYFSYDSVDGRHPIGSGTTFISYIKDFKSYSEDNFDFILSLEDSESIPSLDELLVNEVTRQKTLIDNSKLNNPIAKTLVRASDQFIVERESTSNKSIIAGYPFFEDWGRDTMFALLGSTIATRNFEDAKSIFKSFIKYKKDGLMPNLFPEGNKEPLYNTVDASLLYIYAIYEYYMESDDIDFIRDVALEPAIDIIESYKKGTSFNIHMDDDYLISAGGGYDQVTWMDVRFDTILPTPRHGKPVEINGFWYNALKSVSFLMREVNKKEIANFNNDFIEDNVTFTEIISTEEQYSESTYTEYNSHDGTSIKNEYIESSYSETIDIIDNSMDNDLLSNTENFFNSEIIDSYENLAEKVSESFNKVFWNKDENCLKDVVSGKDYDNQIRSNQIWVTMMPFSPLSKEKSKKVVEKVYNELYTPYGLRTLSKYDKEFKANYGGSHFNRDMSYHQGTVWTFPLGGFLLSYLKVNDCSEKAREKVEDMLENFIPILREGCVGQIAEIYDGLNPTYSRGCFAQAWSVSEILRVFKSLEK
ncbi:MAG: amylo-alpha-1,6-glucosidase [Sarcina sp.]